MVKRHGLFVIFFLIVASVSLCVHAEQAQEDQILKYSCSHQVFAAFENERLNAFTAKTGIRVDLRVMSSFEAVRALDDGWSDIASTAKRLSLRMIRKGYVETPFCKDPTAIVVHPKVRVTDLTDEQLREIFQGAVENWNEVGGENEPIVVISPDKETAAYRNFVREVMEGEDIRYDFMGAGSQSVISALRRFPWSISFLSQGSARANRQGLKLLKVNGLVPTDHIYPYYQIYSFVTHGKPKGAAERFIDFAVSDEGVKIMKERGMILHRAPSH